MIAYGQAAEKMVALHGVSAYGVNHSDNGPRRLTKADAGHIPEAEQPAGTCQKQYVQTALRDKICPAYVWLFMSQGCQYWLVMSKVVLCLCHNVVAMVMAVSLTATCIGVDT